MRADIALALKSLELKTGDIFSLNIMNLEKIFLKITKQFLNENITISEVKDFSKHLKIENLSIEFKKPPFELITSLIEDDTKVWFFTRETLNKQNKYWGYETTASVAQDILSECSHFEYFLTDLELNWILIVNPDDVLTVTSKELIEKLNEISESLPPSWFE